MAFLWLKFLHVLAVAIGVGAMVSQYLLLLAFRKSDNTANRRASESIAFTIGKKISAPVMTLAFLLGIGMIMVNSTYMTLGHMHAKMLFAFLLVGLSHIETANLRKMSKAAETQDEVGVNNFKKRHTIFMVTGSILIVAIFYLIILKPF